MAIRIRRREFIVTLGGAVAWPLAARAQEPGRTYRIGFMIRAPRNTPFADAAFDELRVNGFIDGQNLIVLPGGFDDPNEVMAERATALVKAGPDVIIAGPDGPIRALQAATQTVPIVGMTEDMVAAGLVSSLAHPGSNTTGVSLLSPELDGKRQDILISAVPNARRIAAMTESAATPPYHLDMLRNGARSRGVELLVFALNGADEIAAAMDAAKSSGCEAINFLAGPLFSVVGSRGNSIVMERTLKLRLPGIFQWPEAAEAGGLLAYGPQFTDMYRLRARIAVKVLRGTKPADIPVEQPSRFELVVNLKTAKAIDYEIPAGLVLRADKAIE